MVALLSACDQALSAFAVPCFPTKPNRSVVQHEPFKGLELVCALQEAVLDPSPCVSALGLHAMTVMCETDVLDFYKAWQVRQTHKCESVIQKCGRVRQTCGSVKRLGALIAVVPPGRDNSA